MTTPPTPERPVFTHAEISCLFIALTQMRSIVYAGLSKGQFATATADVLIKAIGTCTIQPIDAHTSNYSVGNWAFSLEGTDISTSAADKEDQR